MRTVSTEDDEVYGGHLPAADEETARETVG
jgi:hypothetical protein